MLEAAYGQVTCLEVVTVINPVIQFGINPEIQAQINKQFREMRKGRTVNNEFIRRCHLCGNPELIEDMTVVKYGKYNKYYCVLCEPKRRGRRGK